MSSQAAAQQQLNCRRAFDCRCYPPIDERASCPRVHRDCICRWTWRDLGWEKGDDHVDCPVDHSSQPVSESPEL